MRDNGHPDAAVGYDDFDVLFGLGIALVGTQRDLVVANVVEGNATIGIGIAPTPGIGGSFFAAAGNQVRQNTVTRSGVADLGIIPADQRDDGNCFSGNTVGTTAPTGLQQLKPCEGAGTGDPAAGALDLGRFLDPSGNPRGRPYRRTPVPPHQPTMPAARAAPAAPAGAPMMPSIEARGG